MLHALQLPLSGKKAYKPFNISYTVARGGNAGPALGTAAPSSLADALRQKRSQQVRRLGLDLMAGNHQNSPEKWVWGYFMRYGHHRIAQLDRKGRGKCSSDRGIRRHTLKNSKGVWGERCSARFRDVVRNSDISMFLGGYSSTPDFF